MDEKLTLWISEIRRYNPRLHLVSQAVSSQLEVQADSCAALLAHIHEERIADLGAGSGMLGVPYAVIHPEADVTLIERSAKKCLFLERIRALLGLDRLTVLQADPLVEEISPFPAVMARAFSPRETLETALCRTLTTNGRFYAVETAGQELLSPSTFTLMDTLNDPAAAQGLEVKAYTFTPRIRGCAG